MKRNYFTAIFLLLLAVTVFVLKRCKENSSLERSLPNGKTQTSPKENKGDGYRGFNRNTSYLDYTKHALCRMDCRKISKEDVKDIMTTGQINYAKSDLTDTPCPTYAVQGYTNDHEHLQVIFAQCNTKTKVVTCYNLDEEFECHCPGDEKK